MQECKSDFYYTRAEIIVFIDNTQCEKMHEKHCIIVIRFREELRLKYTLSAI